MNYKYIYIFFLLISSIALANDPNGSLEDNTGGYIPGTTTPGNDEMPCEPGSLGDPNGMLEDYNCDNANTNTPGNVPINDYIPLLALAAITIGGITFYRNQKQII